MADRKWKGRTPDGRIVELRLPTEFPDQLPEVFLPPSAGTGHIAHVDETGKICIAPASGTLLEATRPEALIHDALSRADAVLATESSRQTQEIEAEYLAYWSDTEKHVVSICSAGQPTGPVKHLELGEAGQMSLVAPDSQSGREWTLATGRSVAAETPAFFIRLNHPIKPPAFQKKITLRDLLQLVDQAAEPGTASSLRAWLSTHGLPATIFLAAPHQDGAGVIAGVAVPALKGNSGSRAQHGFRPGRMPPNVQAFRALGESVQRFGVSRADPEYLLMRGGGVIELRNKSVAVIGCGSVGSFTAGSLAASGIGRLTLVDHEVLTTDNIHRHLLGAAHVGLAKVAGLSVVLRSRFPHLKVTDLHMKAEEALDKELSPVMSSDLVILALGEETIERRLNKFLMQGPRHLHVWLDPLGIGGHVLRVGAAGHPGCFTCLFAQDPKHGLFNNWSLVAPGQTFQRSLAGCSGTFTPFGALDAERAGIEAARAAIVCLSEVALEALLTTWVAAKAPVTRAGYILSPRGERLPEDSTTREPGIAISSCPVCSEVVR